MIPNQSSARGLPGEVESGARSSGRLSVMMTTEGTYPFHGGGVSTWCDTLLQSLPEIDFHLMAVMMNPFLRQRYDLPPNVVELIRVPLWGVEEPMEYSWDIPFSQVYENKRATTEAAIEAHFTPIFRSFVREILVDGSPTLIGMLFYSMHQYFMKYDYNVTFRSRHVWRTFREEMMKAAAEKRDDDPSSLDLLVDPESLDVITLEDSSRYTMPSILEATDCLRWLYRFLCILCHPIPRTDVVHSAAAAFSGIPCIIAKQAYGAPYLLTEHGVYLREQYLSVGRSNYTYHSKRFLMQLIRSVVRCCYTFADIVAPVCRWNTRWERRHGVSADRIRVIYNGVDPNRFAPVPDLPRDPRPTVVTMALIFPLKDIATLIRAADITRRHVPDVLFELYGSASDESYYQGCLRLRERLHLESTFQFMGRTAAPERAYGKADVIALSSLSEAFPFTVVEAMMCGKPVVATDVGGVSEAIGDAGIVVRSRNPEQLAEAIITLLRNPEMRAEMGEDARNRALDYFTIDRCIAEYRQAYEGLIRAQTGHVYEYAA